MSRRLQRQKPTHEVPTQRADRTQELQTARPVVPSVADSAPPDLTAQRAAPPIPAFGHDFSKMTILPPGTETPPDLPSTPVQRRGPVRIQAAEPRWNGVRLPMQRATEDNLGQRIRAAQRGGAPLGSEVQRSLEAGLGADLSNVRVHTDGEADQLSRSVNAVAFTTGPDIFFRRGAYSPGTLQGMNLLAHEATHTIQQAAGPVAGTPHPGGVSISDPGDRFERAAERAATGEFAPSISAQRAIASAGSRPEDGLTIQRRVALPRTHLDGLATLGQHLISSTFVKIRSLYHRYYDATSWRAELEHAAQLLLLIDAWFQGHADPTTGVVSAEDRAKATALQTLQQRLEAEQDLALRLQTVGIAQAYLYTLTPTAARALMLANDALEQGDVVTADQRLSELRTEIGGVTNLVKGQLLRHHIGAINPELARAMDDPAFAVTDKAVRQAGKARIVAMLQDPSFATKKAQGLVAADYATAKQRALVKKAAAPAFGPLTNKEVAFLYHYTSDLYSGFNAPLRGEIGQVAFDAGKLAVTQITISGLNKLPAYTGLCYRHVGIFPGYEELNRQGGIVSDMGFMSTAKEQSGCSKGGAAHDVLEIIQVKTGRLVKDIAYFGTGEEEVLVKPGTRFKVNKRFDKVGNRWRPDLTPEALSFLNKETTYKDTIKMILFKSEV